MTGIANWILSPGETALPRRAAVRMGLGLGFGGLGFRGLGLRVWALGFREGFRGSGNQVFGSGCEDSGFGAKVCWRFLPCALYPGILKSKTLNPKP